MAITTVLFDLDGTLLPMDQDEFVKAYFGLLTKTLAAKGYDPDAFLKALWAGTKAMMTNPGEKTNEEHFWDVFGGLIGPNRQADEAAFLSFYENEFQQVRAACGCDPRATQTRDFRNPRIFDGCSAYMQIGLHAKPGTLNGFLDHVQSGKFFYNYYINGKTYGELAQGALYCGDAGVPVVMVSGDEAACAEAQDMIDGIECAVVKKGIGRNKAECIPSEEALKRIREAAYRGVKKAATIKPFTVDMPAELKLEFLRADYCENHLARHPKYPRLDARTIGHTIYKFDDYLDLVFHG